MLRLRYLDAHPQQALKAGIALIPEDRKNHGLSLAGYTRPLPSHLLGVPRHKA